MEIYKYVKKEDFNEDLQYLWDLIGEEAFMTLFKHYEGWRLNIPSIYSLDKTLERFVKANKHCSKLEIAVKTGFSEHVINQIMKRYGNGA